jgi:hypothetical protein
MSEDTLSEDGYLALMSNWNSPSIKVTHLETGPIVWTLPKWPKPTSRLLSLPVCVLLCVTISPIWMIV